MAISVAVYPLAYLKNMCPNFKKTFLCMLPVSMARSSSVDSGVMLCSSGFVDDVTFSHNGHISHLIDSVGY